MKNPLHAAFYADQGRHQDVEVLQTRELARDTHLLRLHCPEIAAAITPGQFVMVRAPRRDDPLLGRAFALYDVHQHAPGHSHAIDIVFHVIGKMTSLLAGARVGDGLQIWGPLGNGFSPQSVDHLVMVAGGIGQTPFLALAKEYLGLHHFGSGDRHQPRAERVTLCYGARSNDYLAGVEDFEALGVEVMLATDDGSAGHHGLVTDVLSQVLANSPGGSLRIECCGPEPMMEAVSDVAQRRRIDCRVSLETPMACGLGICFSCVTRVRMPDGSWDYKRTCVDGPVFPADKIVW